MSSLRPFDPERIITVLAKHRVSYVMIGALAARLQGFPRMTADIDITPEHEPRNLDRLAKALRELEARVYTESVPEGLAFDFTGQSLGGSALWNLVTTAGRMDIAFRPSGTEGYVDLVKSAEKLDAFGAKLVVASLTDIIRSKIAANRPQDRDDVPVLRAVIEKRRRQKP